MGIKVFIVDDHALVRTGFRLILAQHPDIEIVGEADSGEEALPQIRRLKPDVLLCDLHLPGISGLEVTERVVRGDYGTRVIMVSVLEDGPMPRRLLAAGSICSRRWGSTISCSTASSRPRRSPRCARSPVARNTWRMRSRRAWRCPGSAVTPVRRSTR